MYDPACEKCPLHLLNKTVCAPAKGPDTDSPSESNEDNHAT